ncbi:SHOCT domain-containing protein [Halorussus amylolyticus]|uniref:SHOCT domain-containing protein n=1 Tax=Halorussus amylolyticus TaxID=1126242 RepID=UPI0010516C68|nr:SHOCT domain-containing protein [Halorussus amylolyticus]
MTATPAERLRANATSIASTVVTGVWLAALLTGQSWWLGALLFGYIVVVPIIALLFGDNDDIEEWWDGEWKDSWDGGETEPEAKTESETPVETNNRDALETLRQRYAQGELTDEQFERKLERLLDTETLENVEDRARERARE